MSKLSETVLHMTEKRTDIGV